MALLPVSGLLKGLWWASLYMSTHTHTHMYAHTHTCTQTHTHMIADHLGLLYLTAKRTSELHTTSRWISQ